MRSRLLYPAAGCLYEAICRLNNNDIALYEWEDCSTTAKSQII